MSRTSPSQFELMVDFMERNGDLNKPVDGPSGRLRAIDMWQELANCLNMDTSGTAKPVEKWKKVWSDLKNNTKRKASKIHRSAGGTGGGPACKLTLTDLEQRVLNIIGPQAATGLVSVAEVGLELVSQPEPPVLSATGSPPAEAETITVSPTPFQEVIVESVIEARRPGEGGLSTSQPFDAVVMENVTSPTQHHIMSPQRSSIGPRRAIRGRRRMLQSPPHSAQRRGPRRRLNAADHFINSDANWRSLAAEFVTENIRLREVELQQQTQWQTLFAKLINVIETISNKLNK